MPQTSENAEDVLRKMFYFQTNWALDTRFENLVKWIFGLLNQPMWRKNRFIFEKL